MKLIVVYHRLFIDLGYPPLKERVEPAFRHIEEAGYLDRPDVEVLQPKQAPLELVGRVHTPKHISDVEASGYWEVALLSAGGVIEASRMVAEGRAEAAFCFVGAAGHHASREGFWGFCFLNDVGAAAMNLLDTGAVERLAVLDVDPHFGDGTRDILGPDARVLHVNFHADYGGRGGAAGPNNIDVPLPSGAEDDLFMEHVEGALERIAGFGPDILFVVFGYDSHRADYGSFRLSDAAYPRFAEAVKERFPAGVCYVLSGGAEVDVGKNAIGSVVDILSR